MRQDCIDLLRKIRDAHAETHVALTKLREFVNSGMGGQEAEGADLAYAMNEAYKWADDMRKQLKLAHEIAERATCIILVTKGIGETVRTEYCSATPHVKQKASIPSRKKDPEKFAALMDFLGIRRELWDDGRCGEDEVLRPHWPGLVAYLSELQAAGKPLPPGIDPEKTYPDYALTIRPKKGVLSAD